MWGGYRVGACRGPAAGSLCARQNCVNGDTLSAERTRNMRYDVGGVSF